MSDSRAEVRRRALKRIMDEKNLTPAEVARLAGLPSANAIYNLLHARSKSLSAGTYERLASALGPDVSVADLTGTYEQQKIQLKGTTLRAIAQAGAWRERFELPLRDQREILLPTTREQQLAGAFAVEVAGAGAELRWPRGALLLCLPPSTYENPLTANAWVVLERQADGKSETTVRQIEVENGKAWLWLRTRDARLIAQAAVPMAWPNDARPWKSGAERFAIQGVVVGAYEPMV